MSFTEVGSPHWTISPLAHPCGSLMQRVDLRDSLTTRDRVGVAVVHAPAARITAWGRLRNDGAPARNHGAIMLSKIMQPNAELGMNGQIGFPQR
jgi:hypothetical protein